MQSPKDKFNTLSKKVHKLIIKLRNRYKKLPTSTLLICLYSSRNFIYLLCLGHLHEFFTSAAIGTAIGAVSDILPDKIHEKIYYTIRKKIAVNKGIVEADQSNLKLSNQNSKSLQKSYFEDLPFWAYKLPEDYRANLIDLRKAWYEGKPLNLCTHLQVKLLTLQFLLQDVLWSHISYRLQKVFRPVRKPRL